ncbi:MAG: zinc-dependent metalloprotease, partial [Bacteroidota bacterium]
LIDTDVLARIEPEGMLDRIKSYQLRTLNRLLAGDRVGRIMENEALNGAAAYSMDELMEGLREGIFSEAIQGDPSDPYRRNLQRAYLIKLTGFVDSPESEVAALARQELDELDGILKKAGKSVSDDRSEAHYEDLRSLISISLDDD